MTTTKSTPDKVPERFTFYKQLDGTYSFYTPEVDFAKIVADDINNLQSHGEPVASYEALAVTDILPGKNISGYEVRVTKEGSEFIKTNGFPIVDLNQVGFLERPSDNTFTMRLFNPIVAKRIFDSINKDAEPVATMKEEELHGEQGYTISVPADKAHYITAADYKYKRDSQNQDQDKSGEKMPGSQRGC